jgi:hypothetical protein
MTYKYGNSGRGLANVYQKNALYHHFKSSAREIDGVLLLKLMLENLISKL